MKKIIIISSFFFVLLLISTTGYKMVSANTKIDEVDDIVTYQQTKEDYLTPYNYTLDNPNIVLNPYGNSPLTALIMFETPTEEEVTVTIKGKDQNSTYTNSFKKETKHYIPILGLYANYDNEILIKSGSNLKKIKIKTSKIPSDLVKKDQNNNSNNLYFNTEGKYPYALDNNNDIRWYLTTNYSKKISRLTNGHLMLSTDSLIDNEHTTGLVEIDLLGKVYNEYDISNGYYGSYVETPTTILALSKDLIEIDKQNGKVIRKIKLSDYYNNLEYNAHTKKIILKNKEETLEIDYKTGKISKIAASKTINEQEILLPLYNMDNYKIANGIKFTNTKETTESKKKILLLNYKKEDSDYTKHNINIKKESSRLTIKGNFNKNDNAYIILDKFLDKKIYNLKNGYNYINESGLSGNYSIYIKINDKIYKTNNYVIF